jgi:hypothetical protein
LIITYYREPFLFHAFLPFLLNNNCQGPAVRFRLSLVIGGDHLRSKGQEDGFLIPVIKLEQHSTVFVDSVIIAKDTVDDERLTESKGLFSPF